LVVLGDQIRCNINKRKFWRVDGGVAIGIVSNLRRI
jgi:hypothetical protein